MGRRHVPDRRTARRRHRDRPEVHRPAAPRRDRRRHARHRPGAAAARRPGHREDVGQRAPRGRHQRRLDAARPGHGRHHRGVAPLRLELRPPALRRARARRRSSRARCTGRCAPDGSSASRRSRGCRPRCRTRSSRSCRRRCCRSPSSTPRSRPSQRLQPHRHRQQPRPRHQRDVQRTAPAVQHRRAAAAGHRRTRRWRSSPGASTSSAPPSRCRTVPAGVGRDPPRRHDLPRAARRPHRRRPHEPEVADGTLSTAEAISVVTNGLALAAHFGDGTLRRRRPRRPASSARSSATRPRTTWRGASTSRGWSVTATAGATSTQRAATRLIRGLGRRAAAPARDPASRAGVGAVGAAALDELRPDVVLIEAAGRCRAAPALGRRRRAGAAGGAARLRRCRRARAAFWPLAEFSPEWQAVRWALRHGISPVRDRRAAELVVRPRRVVPADDPRSARSPPIRSGLAAAAGETDPERWWEDVVEHRGDGGPAFEAVAEAMAAVRAATGRRLPHDARREAHMRRAIRAALAGGVLGRGGVRGLARSGARPGVDHGRGRRDGASRCRRRPPKAAVTWVPWSDRRLQRRVTGYGAGVTHPGWYRHVFRHPGPEGVARFFVDAARGPARRGPAGVARPPDRRVPARRRAGRAARPAAGRADRGPRCRRHGDLSVGPRAWAHCRP